MQQLQMTVGEKAYSFKSSQDIAGMRFGGAKEGPVALFK
jgi:hypothetical protein